MVLGISGHFQPELLRFGNDLFHEKVIGHEVGSWAGILDDRALRDEQPDDGLPATGVHLYDDVSFVLSVPLSLPL